MNLIFLPTRLQKLITVTPPYTRMKLLSSEEQRTGEQNNRKGNRKQEICITTLNGLLLLKLFMHRSIFSYLVINGCRLIMILGINYGDFNYIIIYWLYK